MDAQVLLRQARSAFKGLVSSVCRACRAATASPSPDRSGSVSFGFGPERGEGSSTRFREEGGGMKRSEKKRSSPAQDAFERNFELTCKLYSFLQETRVGDCSDITEKAFMFS